MKKNASLRDKALAAFRRHGGMLRTKQVLAMGIHPRTLYALRDAGQIAAVTRGRYRLADLPPLGNPDLVAVASTIPKGVISMISALAFHGITTQVPHQVDVALHRKGNRPRLKYPPVRVFWFSGPAFNEGIEAHVLDGVQVRIYCPAKTVADCFKYRNKIGLDVALEALRECLMDNKATIDQLWHFAGVCRVQRVMRPYLEALT